MTAPKTTLDWEIHNRTLIACRDCERLVAWREQVAREKRRAYLDWDYWGKPVPGFGDSRARLLGGRVGAWCAVPTVLEDVYGEASG